MAHLAETHEGRSKLLILLQRKQWKSSVLSWTLSFYSVLTSPDKPYDHIPYQSGLTARFDRTSVPHEQHQSELLDQPNDKGEQ